MRWVLASSRSSSTDVIWQVLLRLRHFICRVLRFSDRPDLRFTSSSGVLLRVMGAPEKLTLSSLKEATSIRLFSVLMIKKLFKALSGETDSQNRPVVHPSSDRLSFAAAGSTSKDRTTIMRIRMSLPYADHRPC